VAARTCAPDRVLAVGGAAADTDPEGLLPKYRRERRRTDWIVVLSLRQIVPDSVPRRPVRLVVPRARRPSCSRRANPPPPRQIRPLDAHGIHLVPFPLLPYPLEAHRSLNGGHSDLHSLLNK
jgi:hypothetical protein